MSNHAKTPGAISGREPRLSVNHSQTGGRRLSLRSLATMLNALPPEAISLDVIAAALRSNAFYVRYNAAVTLAKRNDRDARLLMQAVLEDKEAPAPVRASVARQVGGFTWYSAELLIRIALADPDSRVREAVVYALCDLHETAAYQLLAEALQNEPDNVRAAAAWGLRDCQDPAAVPVLEVVLHAEDPDVRVQSLEALGANASPQAVPVTFLYLRDSDPDVQYAATLSLLELIGEGALPELAALIRHTQGKARAALLRGLFHGTNYLGIDIAEDESGDLVLDALEEALQDTASEARKAAIWPLSWMRNERAPTILRAAFERETSLEVKAHLVRVAVSLMTTIAEELLQVALNSPDEQVREAGQRIMRERAAGIVARYDESDNERHGLSTPHLT